jgi:hypothetical protein
VRGNGVSLLYKLSSAPTKSLDEKFYT